MPYAAIVAKLVVSAFAVTCGVVGSMWIVAGISNEGRNRGTPAECRVQTSMFEPCTANNSAASFAHTWSLHTEHRQLNREDLVSLYRPPHAMQVENTCFFVTWDVVFIDVHGEALFATIRETAGSEVQARKQLGQHKLNRLYPCIYIPQTFVDPPDGSGGRVMWESLGDAWHMSVGLFMILLFVVWLLSLPSWFPGCRGRGPCLCCLCCPCCRRQDDRVRFADGKPQISRSIETFLDTLKPAPLSHEYEDGGFGSSEETHSTCAICLDGYENREQCKALPCGHHFHRDCLGPWLMQKFHCPICIQPAREATNLRRKLTERLGSLASGARSSLSLMLGGGRSPRDSPKDDRDAEEMLSRPMPASATMWSRHTTGDLSSMYGGSRGRGRGREDERQNLLTNNDGVAGTDRPQLIFDADQVSSAMRTVRTSASDADVIRASATTRRNLLSVSADEAHTRGGGRDTTLLQHYQQILSTPQSRDMVQQSAASSSSSPSSSPISLAVNGNGNANANAGPARPRARTSTNSSRRSFLADFRTAVSGSAAAPSAPPPPRASLSVVEMRSPSTHSVDYVRLREP